MKRHLIIVLGAIFAFGMLASCDKIAPEDYIVYSGATGEWVDGNGVSDKTQRAFIEKYTGVRCPNCPSADTPLPTH